MLEAWNLARLGKGRSVGTEIVLEIDNDKFASLAAHVLSAFPLTLLYTQKLQNWRVPTIS